MLVGQHSTTTLTLEAVADELGISNRLEFAGRASEDELVQLYERATVLVFPSIYQGFGLPVLEVMASGCPAIASNASSIPEVVGDAALIFEPRAAGSRRSRKRR